MKLDSYMTWYRYYRIGVLPSNVYLAGCALDPGFRIPVAVTWETNFPKVLPPTSLDCYLHVSIYCCSNAYITGYKAKAVSVIMSYHIMIIIIILSNISYSVYHYKGTFT